MSAALWEFQHKQADEIYIFLRIDCNDKDKNCYSFRCKEITVECLSTKTERLTRSLKVKILCLTGKFFACLFDLQNVSLRDDLRRSDKRALLL